MQMTIKTVILALLIVPLVVCGQVQKYPHVYPEMPFDLAQVAAPGNTKAVVWKSMYKQAEGDEPGFTWSTPLEESYRYQRYVFPDGKMEMATTYIPNGDKLWSMEYFYRQGLLSAIERLSFDTLQESKMEYNYIYHYTAEDIPFQCVKTFGYPNKNLRLLNQFVIDSLNRVVRNKTTVVGFSPHMDSLVGLKDKETKLTLRTYGDSTFAYRVYKNLHTVLKDETTFYNDQKQAIRTEVRSSAGKILVTIYYEYEGDRVVKKVHWVTREMVQAAPEEEPEADKKKKTKKKKKKKGKEEEEIKAPIIVDGPIQPEIYKIEYFSYTTEGFLETHMIEENGIQTVFEYSFFTE